MAGINPYQAPISYAVDVQSPFEAALGGLKMGAGLAEIQAQQQAREERQTALEAAKTAQNELRTLLTNPNANAADFARIQSFLPKDQAETVRKSFEMLNTQQQQNRLSQAGQVYSAIKAGQPDIAKNLLNEQALALRNTGREDEAKATETYSKLIELNPATAQNTIGILMAGLPNGKETLENIDKALSTSRAEQLQPSLLQKAVSEAEKAKVDAAFAERLAQAGLNEKNWSVKNLQSQISDRAQKLNLDRQITQATVAEKLSSIQQKAVELPADTRKLINESATLAATAKQSANQMEDLANRIEGLGGYGAATKLSEFAKTAIGAENYETSLRQEYTRLRNTAGMKSLPPGPATDKDVQIFFSGYPKDTSDSKLIAQFLRGMAKMQNIDSAIENAKTDWLAQNNGTLTRAKSGFIAGDYAAKAGETFNDFSQRVTIDAAKKYIKPKESSLVSQIPTETTPTTQAATPVSTIRSQADAILRGGK